MPSVRKPLQWMDGARKQEIVVRAVLALHCKLNEPCQLVDFENSLEHGGGKGTRSRIAIITAISDQEA